MWERLKKAGFFVSAGAIIFFILKLVLKSSFIKGVMKSDWSTMMFICYLVNI